MRRNRALPEKNFYCHVYNRIAGLPGELPFDDEAKERFLSLVERLSELFVIDVMLFTAMSNHYHLVLHVPEELPSEEETIRRYEKYYGGNRELKPGPECERMRHRLRDLSAFMHDLQQQFATWYNGARGRRGALWADRYRHTLLEEGAAVRACAAYVALNPVRAGIVKRAGDYRFSSWGLWSKKRRCWNGHRTEELWLRSFGPVISDQSMDGVRCYLEAEIKRLTDAAEIERISAVEAQARSRHQGVVFTLRGDKRVDHWQRGIAIGSVGYIRGTLSSVPGYEDARSRRLTGVVGSDCFLCSYGRLRRQAA